MKQFLIFLLCLAAILSCTPAMASEEVFKEDIYTYTVSGKNVTITNVDDTQKKVSIPETLGGYTVTALGDGACGGSTVIEEVILPDTITIIGNLCFAYSNSLRKIHFSNKLTTVSDGAFYHCEGLWTVALPDGVKTIGNNVFGRCSNLTAVTLPDTIKSIGENVFPDTGLIRIYGKENSIAHNYAKTNEIPFEEYIFVMVNGKEILFDQPCITNTEHYRTLVPLRAVLEELGAEITWDNTFNTAGITVLNHRILIRPGEPFMMLNGVVHYLSCPSEEFNGRVMIPIRDIIEAIGGTVSWNEEQKTVTVTCESATLPTASTVKKAD